MYIIHVFTITHSSYTCMHACLIRKLYHGHLGKGESSKIQDINDIGDGEPLYSHFEAEAKPEIDTCMRGDASTSLVDILYILVCINNRPPDYVELLVWEWGTSWDWVDRQTRSSNSVTLRSKRYHSIVRGQNRLAKLHKAYWIGCWESLEETMDCTINYGCCTFSHQPILGKAGWCFPKPWVLETRIGPSFNCAMSSSYCRNSSSRRVSTDVPKFCWGLKQCIKSDGLAGREWWRQDWHSRSSSRLLLQLLGEQLLDMIEYLSLRKAFFGGVHC